MKKRIILSSYIIACTALVNTGEATHQQDPQICIDQDDPGKTSNQISTSIYCSEKDRIKIEDMEKGQSKEKPHSITPDIQKINRYYWWSYEKK